MCIKFNKGILFLGLQLIEGLKLPSSKIKKGVIYVGIGHWRIDSLLKLKVEN